MYVCVTTISVGMVTKGLAYVINILLYLSFCYGNRC